jgi:tetratricopeptide (TPR) repeat protein
LRAYAHSGLASALLQKFGRYNIRDRRLLDDAVFHAQRAIELDPELDMSNRALAFARHQLSECQADSKDPRDLRASAGNRDEAIRHYKRTYALNRENYPAHNNLANLYLEWGKRERKGNPSLADRNLHIAIKECERALNINPQYHLAYDNLGNTHCELNQLDRAEEAYKSALRYKPNYPEAANDLAALSLVAMPATLEDKEAGRKLQSEREYDALRKHAEALGMLPDAESEPQRKKLCVHFGQRWHAAGKETPASDSKDPLQLLRDKHCTCVALLCKDVGVEA